MSSDRPTRQRRFAPGLRLSLFAGFFFPVLIALGFWQLDRADQKQRVLERTALAAARLPVALAELPEGAAADGRPVRFRARYRSEALIYLDNRTLAGRAGYAVHVPAETATGTVLVDLGWLPWGRDRSVLPEVSLPTAPVIVEGVVEVSGGGPVVFGDDAGAPDGTWPLRVQAIDLEELARRLGTALHPHVIEARLPTPGMLTPLVDADDDRMGPDRHRAYATQWFGLAAVLLIAWLLASYERVPEGASGREEDTK